MSEEYIDEISLVTPKCKTAKTAKTAGTTARHKSWTAKIAKSRSFSGIVSCKSCEEAEIPMMKRQIATYCRKNAIIG